MLEKFLKWVRRHILRQKQEVVAIPGGRITPQKIRRLERERMDFERRVPDYLIQDRIESAKKRRQSLDISKHMKKHGRQAPWYRKSVKAKKKVEED